VKLGDPAMCHRARAGIEPEHHVGRRHLEQAAEVPFTGDGEKRVDDPALG
jgi:hypothetical protein